MTAPIPVKFSEFFDLVKNREVQVGDVYDIQRVNGEKPTRETVSKAGPVSLGENMVQTMRVSGEGETPRVEYTEYLNERGSCFEKLVKRVPFGSDTYHNLLNLEGELVK